MERTDVNAEKIRLATGAVDFIGDIAVADTAGVIYCRPSDAGDFGVLCGHLDV